MPGQVITVNRREKIGWLERTYVPMIVKGLAVSHHPHVPHGIEVYNGKVIFYSLGNFIFGHNHTDWSDNYLARLTLGPDRITKVEILPIAGRGISLSQPHLLEGVAARALLEDVQARTAALDTKMEIVGEVGIITPEEEPRRSNGGR